MRYSSAPANEDRYLAFVLSSGVPIRRVDLGAARPIEQALMAWRAALSHRGDHPEAAAAVRKRLWDPLAKVFPKDVETVFLAPDGPLTLVPWAAIPGVRPQEVLLHEYKGGLTLFPTGEEYLSEQLQTPARLSVPPHKLLAVGGVDYGKPTERDSYLFLEGTQLELHLLNRSSSAQEIA